MNSFKPVCFMRLPFDSFRGSNKAIQLPSDGRSVVLWIEVLQARSFRGLVKTVLDVRCIPQAGQCVGATLGVQVGPAPSEARLVRAQLAGRRVGWRVNQDRARAQEVGAELRRERCLA